MVKGKCHCGKVNYQVKAESFFQFFCHCESCRRMNGGGHLSGSAFPKEQFSFTGTTKVYEYKGGSNHLIQAHFCENCGNHLFAYPTYKDEIVVVKANTFENENDFTPEKSIFVEEGFHWDTYKD